VGLAFAEEATQKKLKVTKPENNPMHRLPRVKFDGTIVKLLLG